MGTVNRLKRSRVQTEHPYIVCKQISITDNSFCLYAFTPQKLPNVSTQELKYCVQIMPLNLKVGCSVTVFQQQMFHFPHSV